MLSLSVATASDGPADKGENVVRTLVAEDPEGKDTRDAVKPEDIKVTVAPGEEATGSDVYVFPVTIQTLVF